MTNKTQDESIGLEQLPQTELESTPDQDQDPPSASVENSSDADQDGKTLPPFLED